MAALLAFALVGIVVVASSLRVVPEGERLAIVRLGRFVALRGPGIVVIVPVVDRAIRFDLERELPHWQSLSDDQIAMEVERRLKL